MLIVFAVYASIYIRLRNRPVQSKQGQNGLAARSWGTSSTFLDESTQGESSAYVDNKNIVKRRHDLLERRRRRANVMIISIAVVFFLSWLPLNTLNVALEISPDLFGSDNVLEGHSRDIHTIGKNQKSINH